MIAQGDILNELAMIETLFNNTTDPNENLLYSKLAIIELCGWLEMMMDEIVNTCASKHLKVPTNLNFYTKEVVRKTSGFQYDNNFRWMLIQLIGTIKVERIEGKVDQAKLTKLKAQLSALKDPRNTAAHTPIRGTMTTFDAPSVTKSRVNDLYEGLEEINTKVKRLRF